MTLIDKGLYYPSINIRDEGWLKNAILYFDVLSTIVPESVDPIDCYSEIPNILYQKQLLKPLFINPDKIEALDIAPTIIQHYSRGSARNIMKTNEELTLDTLSNDKITETISDWLRTRHDILPNNRLKYLRKSEGSWVAVRKGFANYYMSVLATKLSEVNQLNLITDTQLGHTLANDIEISHINEKRLAENLSIEKIMKIMVKTVEIHPDTPIETVLDFKKKHSTELRQNKNFVNELSDTVLQTDHIEDIPSKIIELSDKISSTIDKSFNEYFDYQLDLVTKPIEIAAPVLYDTCRLLLQKDGLAGLDLVRDIHEAKRKTKEIFELKTRVQNKPCRYLIAIADNLPKADKRGGAVA